MQSSTSTSSSETPMEWLARRKAAFALGACKDVYRVTIWCLEVLLRWTIADKIALKIFGRAAAMAWIDISLFLQEADRGEDLDNIVRTLSYRKLPEEKTEMTKPAENETSKQPQGLLSIPSLRRRFRFRLPKNDLFSAPVRTLITTWERVAFLGPKETPSSISKRENNAYQEPNHQRSW